MNNYRKLPVKLIAVIQLLALTLLAACSTVGNVLGSNSAVSPTVCHATGDAANPYEKVTVNSVELDEHRGHPGDFNPAPLNGCPTSPVVISDGKITICHATNSETNPYKEITVSVNGLNGHGTHEGDIIPAPEAGCPVTSPGTGNSDGKITICHATSSAKKPYIEITVSVNSLDGHGTHEGDIIPMPEGGCPTTKP